MSGIFGLVRFDAPPSGQAAPEGPGFARDQHVWLVADARIDNRDELASELQPYGPLLAEPGDAGWILAAWLRWGDRCLDRLVGDFAFALWDARARRLFCARDPLGVKPLCFARVGPGLFAFASEAQEILRRTEVPGHPDMAALGEYLAGLPQSPRRSFFEAIERLPPGHRLTVDAAGLRVERWWEPPAPGRDVPRSSEEHASRLSELFQRAVADRLRTESPVVGIALSGGLDSGSIAAAAQARSAAGGPSILGATFVFDQLRECDERAQVQALAGEIGIGTAWVPAERHWLLSDADRHPPDLESPFLGWQACHRQALELLRARGGRVLLTGHGGDDLFRGSALVYADRLARGDLGAVRDVLRSAGAGDHWRALYRRLVRPLLPTADRALQRLRGRKTGSPLPDWISPELVRRTGLADRIAALQRPGAWGTRAAAEIRGVALDHAGYERIVHWHERHGRSAGVDVRHPFLDKRLFEYVLSLPPEVLFHPGASKPLLRQAVAGLLPEAARLRRDKPAFDRFLLFSLEQEARRIEGILRAPRIAAWGLVDASRLRAAWAALRSGTFSGRRRTFWFALTLELWLREHQDFLGQGSGERESRLPSAA